LSFLSALVRHSTARVIAAIAGIEMPVNAWPQLLPFLLETATSSQATHREVGIYILYTVLETIVEGFQEHLQSFFKLFEKLLQDSESTEVRVTTVRWAGLFFFSYPLGVNVDLLPGPWVLSPNTSTLMIRATS
jgi:hypothetical protein